ncbi:hypothetical protein [Halorubrum kocurii]|uniref:hypothetical protein n=1 Tax=Halorubrum kocurii TaxID=478441 RepID=UPI000AB4B07D|nr:hypothetical protein [Halorubrum kocurii]
MTMNDHIETPVTVTAIDSSNHLAEEISLLVCDQCWTITNVFDDAQKSADA